MKDIEHWKRNGFAFEARFPNEYDLWVNPKTMQKLRRYVDGREWLSDLTTGEYALVQDTPNDTAHRTSGGREQPERTDTMTDAQQTIGAAPEGTCEAVGSAPTFREELEHIINRRSKENGSNTPDYMLADFLCTCLIAFDATVNARDRWYSIAPRSGWSGPNSCIRDIADGKGGGGELKDAVKDLWSVV